MSFRKKEPGVARRYTTTTAVSGWLEQAASTQPVLSQSKDSGHPRVLHVFDQVCNLVDGERRVLSLVTPKIGKGPFSLVVDLGGSRFTDFVTKESKVSIQTRSGAVRRPATAAGRQPAAAIESDFVLQVGSLEVDAHEAEVWDARPLWETAAAAIKTHRPLFESKLAAAPSGSLAHINGRSDPTAIKAKTACPESFGWLKTGCVEVAVRTLQEGLKTGGLTACRESARRLAGLGVGLTPAGDDFLMGVIYGLWFAKKFSHKPATTQSIIEIIAEEAIVRTTTLSGAWLGAAKRGEAGQAWHELVTALGDGTKTACPERVEAAVSRAIDHILETGHTSGADAFAGFVMATSARLTL